MVVNFKYLKIYESFKDDYEQKYILIRSEYDQKKKENYEETKNLVDENLYDLIDYNLVSDESNKYNKDFNLKYKLRFEFNDYDNEFNNLLEDIKLAVSRVNEYTGFDVYFDRFNLYYAERTYHQINFGNISSIIDLIRWKEQRDNLQERAKTKYIAAEFNLIIK
jgi:hypothetical protein